MSPCSPRGKSTGLSSSAPALLPICVRALLAQDDNSTDDHLRPEHLLHASTSTSSGGVSRNPAPRSAAGWTWAAAAAEIKVLTGMDATALRGAPSMGQRNLVELGNARDDSSVSDPASAGAGMALKGTSDGNARKRKEKGKDSSMSTSAKDLLAKESFWECS